MDETPRITTNPHVTMVTGGFAQEVWTRNSLFEGITYYTQGPRRPSTYYLPVGARFQTLIGWDAAES